MIAVTSPGFVLFAALLAGLWYVCPPPRRWQLLLGANLLFYAVLCPAQKNSAMRVYCLSIVPYPGANCKGFLKIYRCRCVFNVL